MRLLLVDDHLVVRRALATLLEQEPDIEIVGEAGTGRGAVEQARVLRPDVILMDISMPEMDGIEATRIIRGECPATCVIGLSMYEQTEQAEAMRDAGAVDYVTKSASAEELLVVLRGWYSRLREELPPDAVP